MMRPFHYFIRSTDKQDKRKEEKEERQEINMEKPRFRYVYR